MLLYKGAYTICYFSACRHLLRIFLRLVIRNLNDHVNLRFLRLQIKCGTKQKYKSFKYAV